MESNKKLVLTLVIGGAILIFLLAFGSRMFHKIKPGERGVTFYTIQGQVDSENPLEPGWQVIAPWNEIITYEVRTRERKEKITALSSNGLDIKLDFSALYNVNPMKIGYLHQKVGHNYEKRVIVPTIRSAAREVIGQYTPEQLYASKREEIQSSIEEMTRKDLNQYHIQLSSLPIRSIILPPKIKQAIEKKLAEEQRIQQKEYAKKTAKKEAERKRIEAKGKADANEILNQSLSQKVLQDKGIDATKQLAKSKNSKVVIIGGGGESGLPLILNSSK
ncbi:MAG: prohibitin family protein [Flavobacteriales bacterium]